MPRLSTTQMQAHCDELVRRNKRFASVIRSAPLCPIGRQSRKQTHMECLVDSIISQQITGKAAQTIYNRLLDAAGGNMNSRALAKLTERQLYDCGLNTAKVRAIQGLAAAELNGEIDLGRIAWRADEDVVAQLTSLYGIGRWTAEMFLIFQLGRLDVWPTGDLAVRRGWDALHKNSEPTTAKQLDGLGEVLRPIRSIAAWYCWRAS